MFVGQGLCSCCEQNLIYCVGDDGNRPVKFAIIP